MADEFETLREVTLGIKGLRTEVRLYVAGFVVALGVVGWGMSKGFDKLDALEASSARMEATLALIAADAAAIKSATKTASYIPPSKSSSGYTGIEGVVSPKDNEAPKYLPAIGNDGPVPAN